MKGRAQIIGMFAAATGHEPVHDLGLGQQKAPTDKPAAVVNGVPISTAEVEAVLKRDEPD